uniref:Protein kinase domain-containing protein n=1 Tax=Brassica oleracea TaxID=3712 RepID=A0A3P6EJN9_BRAOL|nr:unnamed protein product [Brassica oleracea]
MTRNLRADSLDKEARCSEEASKEKPSSSEKRSSRINSSSQSKDEQQDKSKYRDAKVQLIEPETFSSARFSEKHPEIPEIGDTDDEEKEQKREPDVQVACLTPRRAISFEKLDKIGQGTYSSLVIFSTTTRSLHLKRVRCDLTDLESVKYMDHDLLGLASIPGIKFSQPQVKCYMKQLLSGLHHCHSRGVLHRDIKGSNLLIDSNGVLKIADFGLATFFDPRNSVPLTSRVVTLWYRPPELLLGACHYGVGVDLWSAGCILDELYSGKPILPGKTEQLHKIFKLCGSPTEDYWRKLKLPPSAAFRPSLPYGRHVAEMFKDLPTNVLSLLEALLSIDPEQRGSAAIALESEYFSTESFACDPSSLPKYPPIKEIDAKLRDEAKRQQRRPQEKQDSLTRRSHERKLIPPVKANPSLAAATENPYLRRCVPGHSTRQMQITKDMTSNNATSGRVSYSVYISLFLCFVYITV